MDSEKITKKEAYISMFKFLDRIYSEFNIHDLGSILGSMSFLQDGTTTDPAYWQDWVDIIDKVKNGNTDIDLKLKQ